MQARRLLWWGAGLWTVVAAELVLATLFFGDLARGMAFGISSEIFAGREVGIPVALQAGVPPWLVAQVSFTQDIGSALLVYPLFQWLITRYHEADNAFMRRLRRIESAADRHQTYVRRWGPLGLGLFMLMPFLVNGPLVGLVLGRLAGLHERHILVAVVAATAVAAVSWTFFFDAMRALVAGIHPWAGWFIAAAMLAVVVGLATWDWIRDHLRHRHGAMTK